MMKDRHFQGGAAALSGLLFSAAAQTTNLPPLVEWDAEAELAISAGYRDNVLRSSMNDEDSGFIMTSLDASLFRFSETGSYLMLYLFGEDIRYFDAPSVNYEQFFSGLINCSKRIGEGDDVGFEVQYLYLHQVYDASETQEGQGRLLVLGHSLIGRPYWNHMFGRNWEARVEAGAMRQIYEQELDDFTEADGEASLTRNYGHRSEWSAGYQYLQRYYDTREQFDEFGVIIPGTDLIYAQHKLAGEIRHYWDEAREWRSLSQLSVMMNRDNGSGYFDYDRVRFREQLRWDNEIWAVAGNARFGWYFYKQQTVGTEKRDRSFLTLDLRIERCFGNHWALFASAEYEWNISNDPVDEYNTWMINSGVSCAF
ncbi:hypothetical protein P4B35_21175 [Pontiellaceae bacterium B12227]|nr:hypothetical protein [Pontiellaceae bacterium B12227]